MSSHATCDHRGSDAEILGLEPHESDPVRIILAAQLRLRRFRHGQTAGLPCTGAEVRRIIAARDALLRQAVGSLTRLSPAGRLSTPSTP